MPENKPDPEDADIEPDAETRATKAIEDAGGIPDDNPFGDVVRDLREDGASWQDVWEQLEAVYNPVDQGAYEESFEVLPKWRVAYVVPDADATSGERYEYQEPAAESREEAEEGVAERTGYRVESSKTEHIGWAKVG